MGIKPTAILEIDAFRLPGDPSVLNVQAIKTFLASINNSNTQVTIVKWYSPHSHAAGYEDSVNNGNEPIDEELTVSGIITHGPHQFSFGSQYWYNEYFGNSKPHALAICLEARSHDTLEMFVAGATALLELRAWIVAQQLANEKAITTFVTAITT